MHSQLTANSHLALYERFQQVTKPSPTASKPYFLGVKVWLARGPLKRDRCPCGISWGSTDRVAPLVDHCPAQSNFSRSAERNSDRCKLSQGSWLPNWDTPRCVQSWWRPRKDCACIELTASARTAHYRQDLPLDPGAR